MSYILTNEQSEIISYPYSVNQLRKDNPNTSFPSNPSDELLAEWGVYPVTVIEIPAYNEMTQTIEQKQPQKINGAWVVSWLINKLPLQDAENNVRNTRNALLAECDWTQLADASVNSLAWANYRQTLRDIPQQEGFPYSVTWPIKPV